MRIGQEADLVVVAPATADVLARAAAGRADDLLTATLLTARCPVLFAPAMHTEMWQHPATCENVATLRERGAVVLEPASGRLTGADTGPGRLPEPEEIIDASPSCCWRVAMRCRTTSRASSPGHRRRHPRADRPGALHRQPQFRQAGLRGGPRGRRNAVAEVTLVAGNTAGLADPAGVEVVHIGSATQLRDAVSKRAPDANVLVMAAAVADFRPAHVATTKMKKGADSEPSTIDLIRNDDVLAAAVRSRTDGQLPNMRAIVGFAAETGDANGDVLFHARAKLQRKGCDLLVVNAVGDGRAFEVDNNDGWLSGRRRHRGRTGARVEDIDGQPYCGRDRGRRAGGLLTAGGPTGGARGTAGSPNPAICFDELIFCWLIRKEPEREWSAVYQ